MKKCIFYISTYAILFIICTMVHTISTMDIYEYRPDLLQKDVVPTEFTAYTLLTQNPLSYDVTYVAIAWTWFINNKKFHEIPKNIRFNGGFTVCQHIRYEAILPLLRTMGINVLFTPHASRIKKYEGITVLPFPHYAVCTDKPSEKKDLLYSFMGAETDCIRKQFFRMNHLENTLMQKRRGWHFWLKPHERIAYRKDYIDALQRSRFAPCLRGTGPSTIRFWEALKAGAIPVLVSDDMTLPQEVDWDTCIIRIAEKDIFLLPQVVQEISQEKENAMRNNCINAYTLFSEENFVQTIRVYYDRIFENNCM